MRQKEVCEFTGFKPAMLNNSIRAGLFPRPFRIGVRAKAWKREEVRRWLADRDTERATFIDPAVPNPLTDQEKVARYEAAQANVV